MILIGERAGQSITEHSSSFVEAYPMLAKISLGFLFVPGELHSTAMLSSMRRGFLCAQRSVVFQKNILVIESVP
jgi:hypothetical protein